MKRTLPLLTLSALFLLFACPQMQAQVQAAPQVAKSQEFIPYIQQEDLSNGLVKLKIGTEQGQFEWSTGEKTPSIVVDGMRGGEFFLLYTPVLQSQTWKSVLFIPGQSTNLRSATSWCDGAGYTQTHTSICQGQTATLTARTDVAGAQYAWSTGETTASISVSPSISTSYGVTITGPNNNCSANYSIPIQVISGPAASIIGIVPTNNTDCTPGNMSLQLSLSDYTQQANYSFRLNGSSWQSSRSFGPLGRGEYTAQIRQNNNGCTSSFVQYVNEFQGFEGGVFTYENLGDCQLNNVSVSYGKESGFGGGGMEFRIDGRPWQWMPTFTGLGSGTYTYYARQSGGSCAFSTTFTVTETQGPALSGASVENQQDCITGNSQIRAQTNNAGFNQLEYQLNGGAWQSSPVFSNLSSGTYTLAIRSTGGSCAASTNTFTQTINEVYLPVISQIAVLNDNDCTTGNIQLTATLANPVAGMQYRRNGGAWQSSPTFSGLSSGNHTIEATLPGASGGCIASLSRNVMEFQTVSLTALTKLNDLDCTTGNAIIEAVHNGGTLGGIEFSLNNGPWQSSNRFTGLGNGTYTVATRISGAGGCTVAGNSLQTTITERSGNVVISGVSKGGETDCFVGNSRVAVFLATPVPGVYYRLKAPNKLWQTSNDVSVGGSGTYVIQASTINTPGSCIAEITVVINEVAGAVTALNLTGHTDCQMNNVTITAVHTGTPNSGIQFRLKKNNDAFGAWQNSPEFRNQGNGTYVVESKTSNNCTGSRTITVDEGPAVVPQITGLAMIGDDTDCVNGNADFRLITNESNFHHEYRVNGGTWRNPISNPFNAPYYYNFSRDSITAELRYYYGDDNTSWTCIVRTRLLVNEHVPLEITSVSTALVDDCLRNNAQATVNVKNSFGTLRYNRNGGTFRIGNPIFTNLSSGEHTFIALDDRLCRDTMVVNFTEPALLKITSTTKANETDCIPNNATITVNTTGARGGLSYRAGTGAWFGSNPISGLGTGTYKVMAQDATGCKDSVNVSISERAMPAVTKVQDSVAICAGTSATLSIDGGGTYNWSNGLGTAATVSVTPSATTTYTVTVTHASSGCTVVATRKVIVRPLPQFGVTSGTACRGQGGTINIISNENLQYSFDGITYGNVPTSMGVTAGGSVSVIAKNQYGCTNSQGGSISIIQTGGQILGPDEVCPGVPFTLTLSPNGGSQVTQTYTITAPQVIPMGGFSNGCPFDASKYIALKPLPTLQIQAPDSLCAGTTTIATVSTSPGVSYLWATGATSSTLPMHAGETMMVTVTAPNGCKASDTHTIHSLPIPAPLISASGPLNCAGDSVTLSAIGLLPGTSYQWSNGKTTPVIRVAPTQMEAYILSATRSGCVGISNVLTLTPLTALSISDTLVQPICYGTATGQIGISVAGGTLPYVYVWSNGASTASINNLRAGTYSVTVTDGKGCSLVESFLLGEPAKIQLALTKLGENDCPTRNLKIKASSSNGVGRVLYRLDELAYDTTSTWAVSEGLNKVWAKDSLGCEVWDTVRVKEKLALDLQVIVENDLADCITGNVGVRLLARHARGAVVFSSAEGETLDSVFVSGSRFVKIYALDSLGCRDSAILNVKDEFPNNWWSHTLIGDQDCISGNSSIQVSLGAGLSGIPILQLEGKAPRTSSQIDSLRGGFHFLRIQWQDCIDSTGIEMDEKLPRINNYEWLKLDDCQLGNAGIRIKADTSNGPIRYRVNNGPWQNSPVFDSLSSGSYTASIINALGCTDSLQVLVVADVLPGIESVKQSTSCDTADGEILFRLDYGTVAYQYSINGGSTWQNSPRFVGLAPGVYHPVRRSLQGDCQEQLDSIRIGTVDCAGGPVAYFLQDLINLNEDNQIALIRLEVVAPAWFQGPYAVKVRLEGDGSPHLNLGTRTNANQVELRNDTSQVAYEQVYNFSGPGVQQATLTVPLQEEAYLYRFPSDYLFHLEPTVGEKVLVDPQRDLTKVTVNFYGPTSEEIIEVDLCEPCGVLGKGYTIPAAKCYLWEKQTNGNTSELRVCQAGEYTRYALDNNLRVIKKTIYKVTKSELAVKIVETNPLNSACQTGERSLSAIVTPENLANSVTYVWNTGETTSKVPINGSLGPFTVTVTNPQNKCTVTATLTLQNREAPCVIRDYFIRKGFFAIPISNITDIGVPGFVPEAPCPNLTTVTNGTGVIDLARKAFNINGGRVYDPQVVLQRFLSQVSAKFRYPTATGQISENEKFCCASYLDKLEARFEASQLGYWLHIWEGQCGSGEGPVLFIKAKMPDGKKYPDNNLDQDFLKAALSFYTELQNSRGDNLLVSMTDQCLDNFVDEKTPDKFNHLVPTKPRETELLNTENCRGGFNPGPEAVITPSAQLVMLPANAYWRFRTPKNKKFVDGALTGFTTTTVVPGDYTTIRDYNGEKPVRVVVSAPSTIRWGAIYEARTLDDDPNWLEGYFNIQYSSDIINPYVFSVPTADNKPNRAYIGKLQDRHLDPKYNSVIEIYAIPLSGNEQFISRPDGPLVSNLASKFTVSSESVWTFNINPQDLVEIAEGFNLNSGLSVQNLRIGFVKPLGSSASLSPGIMFQIINPDRRYSYLYFTPDVGGVPGRKYEWNCNLAIWEEMDQATLSRYKATIDLLQRLWPVFFKRFQIHQRLELASFVSVIGGFADIANGILYIREGNDSKGKMEIVFGVISIFCDVAEALSIFKALKNAKNARLVALWDLAGDCGLPGFNTPELRSSSGGPCALIGEQAMKAFDDAVSALSSADEIANINRLFGELYKEEFAAGKLLPHWVARLNPEEFGNLGKILSHTQVRDLQFNKAELKALFNDIGASLTGGGSEKNKALFNALQSKPELAYSWRVLHNAGRPILKFDLDLLEKIHQLSKTPLSQFIDGANAGTRKGVYEYLTDFCKAYDSKNFDGVRLIGLKEHLDNFKYFVDNLGAVDGGRAVINSARNGAPPTQDGLTHMFRKLKELGYDNNKVTKFEGKILEGISDLDPDDVCVNCLFDAQIGELVNGKPKIVFLEFKSYGSNSIAKISKSSNFIRQFEAYLLRSETASNFRYFFNSSKVGDVNLIKDNFVKIFTDDYIGRIHKLLSTNNPNFLVELNAKELADFKSIVRNRDSDFYNFIKLNN